MYNGSKKHLKLNLQKPCINEEMTQSYEKINLF